MDERTLTALMGSILKWEKILAGTGTDEGVDNCPLCQEFLEDNCRGCPVAKRTGEPDCFGSPYYDYTDGDKEAAQAELDFLRSLLPAKP